MNDPWRIPRRAVARRREMPGTAPAWAAAELVAGERRPAVLAGCWAGVRAIVASEPVATLGPGDDPFAALDRQPAIGGHAGVAFGGGWIGYLGFGLARAVEPIAPAPPAPARLPDAVLAFYDHVLVLDDEGRWWFEALETVERLDALRRRRRLLAQRLRRAQHAAPAPAPVRTGTWRMAPGSDAHAAAVQACRDRIAAGDLFQANLATRLATPAAPRPEALFGAGVRALAPDRAACLSGRWGAVVSLSPELFVERRGRQVRTAPIKGTRPLAAHDAAESARQRTELAASVKERAENVMIVDLMRNDLGRVCRYGSVRVPALTEVREHAGVWHLVSEVTGELADGLGDGDLLRATFPPGSVTGAPKVAALDVIHELEASARQAYTGTIGFASPIADLELSVAIRTFEQPPGGGTVLQVGGGIVSDSDPAAEARECHVKALPLLAAVGGTIADPPAARPAAPPRHSARPARRPGPGDPLHELLLVAGGEVAAFETQLARLAASVAELHGRRLPPSVAAACHRVAALALDIVLEVTVHPTGHVDLSPRRRRAPRPVDLRTVVVPGGLGPHAWASAPLLDELRALAAPCLPLVVDGDGSLLAPLGGSLLLVRNERLLTPVLYDRMPGAALDVLDSFESAVARMTLDDLAGGAALVVLDGHGVRPIRSVDSMMLPAPAAALTARDPAAPAASARRRAASRAAPR